MHAGRERWKLVYSFHQSSDRPFRGRPCERDVKLDFDVDVSQRWNFFSHCDSTMTIVNAGVEHEKRRIRHAGSGIPRTNCKIWERARGIFKYNDSQWKCVVLLDNLNVYFIRGKELPRDRHSSAYAWVSIEKKKTFYLWLLIDRQKPLITKGLFYLSLSLSLLHR